jgi:hypothetical protein
MQAGIVGPSSAFSNLRRTNKHHLSKKSVWAGKTGFVAVFFSWILDVVRGTIGKKAALRRQ